MRSKMLQRIQALPFILTAGLILVSVVRSIGVYRIIPIPLTLIIYLVCALLSLWCLRRTRLKKSQVGIWFGALGLVVYSAAISIDPNISLFLSFFILVSATYWLGLAESQTHDLTTSPKFSTLDSAKLGFFAGVNIHALSLVVFYLFMPERTSGLMDDFSQASMLLLCAYLLIYPILSKNAFFSAISAVYFFAFFTTFSRTSNALLVIAMLAILLMEFKNKDLKLGLKFAGIALLMLALVYIYPNFFGESAVDRGGLSHFSTLNSRTIYWETAWNAIKDNPWLGYGIGTYANTGIREAQPFNVIFYAHNDYLQAAHDFGIVWFTILLIGLVYLLVRSMPLRLNRQNTLWIDISTSDQKRFLSWVLLLCMALYMSINFLYMMLEFQIAFALLSLDLTKK